MEASLAATAVMRSVIRIGVLQMQLWHQLVVPDFCERMIGFSIPNERELLLVTYDGLKIMHLTKPISIRDVREPHPYYEHCEPHFVYNHQTKCVEAEGKIWQMLGLHPGEPLMTRPNGDQLQLNERDLTISVTRGGKPIWLSSYENFSGDWVAATFSPDDWYIVLGCPYDFDFRVWERHPSA